MRRTRAHRQVLTSVKLAQPRRSRPRTITLGDLVSAACDIGGSARAAARLLSPDAPLAAFLDRRIVVV
jgi:hypothetical protein